MSWSECGGGSYPAFFYSDSGRGFTNTVMAELRVRKRVMQCILIGCLTQLAACSAPIGSEKWCDAIKDKPEGDWTLNEAKAYAKHCLFRK